MQPFTTLAGYAAPLSEDDIDTDTIYPARFLLLMNKTGLGDYAFHDRRFVSHRIESHEFVLNQPPWRDACILVAGRNFGCGSSREQAVWSLSGFGIRCVIAGSFGEIFLGNCLQNGVLAISLPMAPLQRVTRAAAAKTQLTVDLTTQLIGVGEAASIPFKVEPRQREALLNGWDATDMILQRAGDAIDAFEQRHMRAHPWLF